MGNKFEHLRNDEVISVEEELHKNQPHIIKSTTFQVSELVQKLTERISSKENLIFNGFDCKVLRLGSGGWVKGKIKLALEFYPDEQEVSQTSEKKLSKNSELESPLDDLRQKFNEEN
ncbi:KGK domain-containing protein [Okeania sp. KiyG1]|uniref:KGK domain-containing protein n=1 Tax=Okeania sp. KiyG1 TaxID=2720165 RepID=UPI001924D76A|nr:KGK domain-containing protein [Okeania sp. KiyG1]GGA05859.1 hypothetical protein CYANOKiyG1_18330 [Okeania sp. KiyG1]